jgi:hypothetical protein
MKVKCIAEDIRDADLVYGKVYDVISIELDWYRIIDESEEDYMYSPKAFEIVETLPKPPVLTEEDIQRGRGGMYMITDPYGDLLRSHGLTREEAGRLSEEELELALNGHKELVV